ncbi:MAG: hypothetical protein ACSHYF_16920 [Verrucomicrobiaceae bacterium]
MAFGEPDAYSWPVDQSVDQERLREYQERVGDWIGQQGLLFQLRYAKTVGNYSVIKQLGNVFVKLLVVSAGIVGVGYVVLNRHFESKGYEEKVSEGVTAALGADEIEINGFSRSRGQGLFREIELEGGEESFFMEADMESLSGSFEFLAGVTTPWAPDQVRIKRASFQLKAGGGEEEMEKAFSRIIESFEGEGVTALTIDKLSFDWGYSKLTYGAVTNTFFEAILEDGKWEVSLKGGEFSQNWIKGFTIEKGELTCGPDGIEVKSLDLTKLGGSLVLSGRIGESLAMPVFDLKGEFLALPIEELVELGGVRVKDFLSGTISGDLKIFGSSNRKIETSGTVKLATADRVVIRESWDLLKALSVIDISQNYRRVDFETGGFKFVTGSGGMEIKDISIRSGNMLRLEGNVSTRLPTQQEAADSLGITLTEGFEGGIGEDITDVSSAQALENERMSLKRAAGGGKVNDLEVDLNIEASGGGGTQKRDTLSAKEMEESRLRLAMNVHRVSGEIQFGVGGVAFRDYASLQQLYPSDEEGWRWLPLRFNTTFSKISEDEADKLLADSRITLKRVED